MVLAQLEVERHEAGEGDEVGGGDLAEQAESLGGAPEVGVSPEELAGYGLVITWVEAVGDGPSVDSLQLSQGSAAGEQVVAEAPVHPAGAAWNQSPALLGKLASEAGRSTLPAVIGSGEKPRKLVTDRNATV